jgi:hypothetical protein
VLPRSTHYQNYLCLHCKSHLNSLLTTASLNQVQYQLSLVMIIVSLSNTLYSTLYINNPSHIYKQALQPTTTHTHPLACLLLAQPLLVPTTITTFPTHFHCCALIAVVTFHSYYMYICTGAHTHTLQYCSVCVCCHCCLLLLDACTDESSHSS